MFGLSPEGEAAAMGGITLIVLKLIDKWSDKAAQKKSDRAAQKEKEKKENGVEEDVT